jgi:hypothetical protein
MTNRRNSSELISPDAVYDSAIGSAVLVVGGQLPDAVFVELGDQAVIARKRNDEHFAHGVILQAMGLAVDSAAPMASVGGPPSSEKTGMEYRSKAITIAYTAERDMLRAPI